MHPRLHRSLALGMLIAGAALSQAQTIDPYYAGAYNYVDLGTPAGVPGPLGGLTLLAGSNDTLLIGGSANQAGGTVQSIGLTRSEIGGLQRITGFSGTSSTYASAPQIDGGLTYGPNGSLLFTGYSNNTLGEIKPGSVAPDRITNLSTIGIASSTGTLTFVPGYAPGSGRLKVLSYSASILYDVPYTLDASGLYTFSAPTSSVSIGGGPEGIIYVPAGSAFFPTASMLVSEYGSGQIVSYEVDAIGNPIVSTKRLFMTGLSGAEGAYIDPTTGDFLFSTFNGGNRVIAVRGFAATVPEPASFAVLGLSVAALLRRRKRAS